MEVVSRRRILVAVDESEESMHALKWAVDNLQLSPADTLILRNIERFSVAFDSLGDSFVLRPGAALALKKYQDRIAEGVKKKARKIYGGSQVKVEEKIVFGDATESLCEAVKKFEVDLLVLGRPGYSYFKRTCLGSFSDYRALHATCPIRIVMKPHH